MKTYRLAPSLLSADFTELGSQIDLLKSLGVRALHCDIMDGDFVPSISFGTPLVAVEDILPELDMVLIMSVNPGFGGQSYIPYCTDKIRRLRALADQKHPELSIQVDGGVNRETLAEVLAAGADDFVAGSAVFGGNIAENVAFFRDAFRQAEAKEKA